MAAGQVSCSTFSRRQLTFNGMKVLEVAFVDSDSAC
jgi:hypothetical protein